MTTKTQREEALRQEMVRVGRLVWERGYVAASDGNLSARLGDDRILVTASGLSKGFLSVDDLLVVDLDGRVVETPRVEGQRPSSELMLHLEVYRQRSDLLAVIHAHPPIATACGIAGECLDRCVLPEVTVTLGGIPTMTYATPGTQAVPDSIHDAIRDHDALLLAHHGSLTAGRTLWEAYLRLEKVEHAAQILMAACQLGGARELPPEEESRLREKRQAWLQAQGRD